MEAASLQITESVLASNAWTIPSVAQRLSRKPVKGEDASEQAIKDDSKSGAAALGPALVAKNRR